MVILFSGEFWIIGIAGLRFPSDHDFGCSAWDDYRYLHLVLAFMLRGRRLGSQR